MVGTRLKPGSAARAAGRAAKAFAAVAASLISIACGGGKPLAIGFIGELSGNNADIGEAGRNGALLAIELHNDSAERGRRKVELIVRDDLSSSDGAVRAAHELAESGVEVAIGPFNTAMADAALPEAERAGLLLVSPTVSAHKYYGVDDMLIRLNSTTRDNAGAYAEFMARRLGIKTVAIAFDKRNRAFSESWAEEFAGRFMTLGGEVAAQVPFDEMAGGGYGVAIATLVASGSRCFVFVANAVDSARLAQLARKAVPGLRLAAAEWAATGQLIELGGRDVEGMIQLQTYDADSMTPDWLSFRDAYRTRFRAEPSFSAVAAYDAVGVVLSALGSRKKGQSAKDAILSGGPYQGLQQEISFDHNGDTVRLRVFTEVRDGVYRAVDPAR